MASGLPLAIWRMMGSVNLRSDAPVPGVAMTICPVAIAVGCKKCPIFSICPAKSLIGDYRIEDSAKPKPPPGKNKRS